MADSAYIAIDLKSFYALIERPDCGVDLLDTNLLLKKQICATIGIEAMKSHALAEAV